MAAPESDAFVFFGATGDLAYKKIFPALQALVREGHLAMPIIGMARAGWTLDKLRDRARDSLEHNGGVDADAFLKLSARLKYVGGDYQDPATYERLRQALGEVVELPEHPWFLAVQYHPEFKSKPTSPQPLFAGFVGAAVAHSHGKAGRPVPANRDETATNPRRTAASK